MVYEWVKVELYGANNDGQQVRYTIADGVSVSKGQVLYLTDPRTASGAALGSVAVAGVAAEDKIAGDGVTSISCYTQGIFEVRASGAILVGDSVMMDGSTPNTIEANSGLASGALVGRALETAAANEVINVRLNL